MESRIWSSPINVHTVTQDSNRLLDICADKFNVCVLESRPSEGGKSVLVGSPIENYNVSTRVHEYGGGAVAVRDGMYVFNNGTLEQLMVHKNGETRVVYQEKDTFVADFDIHKSLGYVAMLVERHADIVSNAIGILDLETNEMKIVLQGNDFYSCPRFSPDGKHLLWITWNHPDMPWTNSTLYYSNLDFVNPVKIAGGLDESISRPLWATDDSIYFISDRTGYYNIHRYFLTSGIIENMAELEADFSSPDWEFKMSSFDVLSNGDIAASYSKDGVAYLCIIDHNTLRLRILNSSFASISQLRTVFSNGQDFIFFIGTRSDVVPAVYRVALDGGLETIRKSSEIEISKGLVSNPRHISFPVKDRVSHMFYYPPQNDAYVLERPPPLIVSCHGGPTAHADGDMSLEVLFWTSRGFAFAKVNYGGSSNYGKAYRKLLDGKWGIVDMEDTCEAANYLAKNELADKNAIFIRGGSSGGYTVLCCLCFRPQVFSGGVDYYGICDLEALAKFTHKFELHYMESLVGGKVSQIPKVYHDRSPIHFASSIQAPLLVLQGEDDQVVPKNQSELMVNEIRSKNGKVEYVLFQGERHGFKKASSIQQAYTAELEFYKSILEKA